MKNNNYNDITKQKIQAQDLNNILCLMKDAGLLEGDRGQINYNKVLAYENKAELIPAISALNQASLLTGDGGQENFNTVILHENPQAIAATLRILAGSGLLYGELAKDNREAILEHRSPWDLAAVFSTLQQAGLFTGKLAQANFNAFIKYQYPKNIIFAISILRQAQILDFAVGGQSNFEVLLKSSDPINAATTLQLMNSVDLLTEDMAQINRDAVASHQDLWGLSSALLVLKAAGGVNNFQNIFNILVSHDYPEAMATLLCSLTKIGLLEDNLIGQDNFNRLINHQDPWEIAYGLRFLSEANLLSDNIKQSNFDLLMTNETPADLTYALRLLQNVGLLTQENFNALHINSEILFTHPQTRILWLRLAVHLTQERLNEISIICQGAGTIEARQIAFTNYAIRLLRRIEEAHQLIFNANQSTHTASVHASVSKSATNLQERYGKYISGNNLNNVITGISSWINALPSTFKNNAAKRCIERITEPTYSYVEPVSELSILQLLGLSWIAINDDNLRIGDLTDAQNLFIDGLYEIQRTYNLSANGMDDHGNDIPACTGGCFNKLIEKLCGVHPDVSIIFLTKETATYKLLSLIPQEVNNFLTLQTKKLKTAENAIDFVDLIKNRIDNDGLDAVVSIKESYSLWNVIVATIAKKMFAEFGSLYKSIDDPEFVELINAGIYCALEKVPDFQREVCESAGYQAYMQSVITKNYLFIKDLNIKDINENLSLINDLSTKAKAKVEDYKNVSTSKYADLRFFKNPADSKLTAQAGQLSQNNIIGGL